MRRGCEKEPKEDKKKKKKRRNKKEERKRGKGKKEREQEPPKKDRKKIFVHMCELWSGGAVERLKLFQHANSHYFDRV